MRAPARLLSAALAATVALTASGLAPAGAAPPPARLHRFSAAGGLSQPPAFTPPGATPVVGDFDHRDGQDIIWYTPGAGGDAFWSSDDDGTWTTSAVSINGTYTPYVGQFTDEDKGDDVLWYSTNGASQLWDYENDEEVVLTKTALPSVTGTGTIIVGDFLTDGATDLIRYRPGAPAEKWWDFDPTGPGPSITNRSFNVNGTYTPVVGQFHSEPAQGDYGSDILWYAPGAGGDSLWDFAPNASATTTTLTINGSAKPLVGRWMASTNDQILWYTPGAGGDSLWSFANDHTLVAAPQTINGTYTPYTCDCVPSGLGDRDDIVLHGTGTAADSVWSNNGTTFAPTKVGYAGTSLRGTKLVAVDLGLDAGTALIAYG